MDKEWAKKLQINSVINRDEEDFIIYARLPGIFRMFKFLIKDGRIYGFSSTHQWLELTEDTQACIREKFKKYYQRIYLWED